MPLTREERKLLHHKSKQPTFGSGKPNKREGNEGDISFRKVEGSGTVQYLKEGDDWVAISATGTLPTIRLAATSGGASGGGGGVGGATSHSSLGGLAGDDHPHYLLVDTATRELTADWDAGSFDITAEQFHSDILLGTAPFTVVSSTEVANLNASLLSGADWDAPLDIGGTTPANAYFTDLDVDGATTLDQVTIDVTDGDFKVEGSTNSMDIDVAADFDLAVTMDQVTIDTSDGAFSVDGTNGTTINSTAGSLSIGNDADDFEIYIGTAGERTIQIGNSSAQTAALINMYAAQGGINFDTVAHATADTGDITFETGDATAANSGSIIFHSGQAPLGTPGFIAFDAEGGEIQIGKNTAAGDIDIGTNATARTITMGNITGATALNFNAGTGGIALASTGAGDITINSDDTLLLDADGVLELNSSAGEIKIGDDAVASKIWVGGDYATRTEVELNAILIDINAGIGGAKIESGGVVEIDSVDSTRLKMEANISGSRTLSIEAANSHLTGVGHLDIDADGDIGIDAVGALDLDSANGTWDATTLSIDCTDDSNISMNANDGADKTLRMDAENAGVGLGEFRLHADIITFETPYVATSDENQTNSEGSWNFTNNDDLSFYSTSVDTWINAKDNNLMIYSGFDMSLIVDGMDLYIKDTALNTVYTFAVGASPALTVLAGDGEPNGAPFLIENQGTDGDIKLRPMGGDLYIQSSGSDNTFRFNATTSQFLINNTFDDALDPQIIFTNDATGDDWSMGIDVGDEEDGYNLFKIHSTTTLAGIGDFELNTNGDGRFRGDLDVDGKNIVMGIFNQELNANLTERLEIQNTNFGVHINDPWAYADAPHPTEHWYDSWNVRTQLGDYDGNPLSQHLCGGYADFYNNYFIVGCFYEQAGVCAPVSKLYAAT